MKELFKVGDTVYHDYSGNIGEVHEIRDNPDGYNYFVRFLEHEDDLVPSMKDWFKAEVLRHAPKDKDS